jgi:predicted secreted protein
VLHPGTAPSRRWINTCNWGVVSFRRDPVDTPERRGLPEMNMPKKAENPKPVDQQPKKTGRPPTYSKELSHKICELLSEGVSLREICRMDGMPYWRTVYLWMAQDEELAAHIARARQAGYDAIAEECLTIANTPLVGEIVTDDGEKLTIRKEDMLGHRKLQIETRLKLLAKWDPKRYGDRVALTGAEDGAPIKIESRQLFDAVLTNIETRRQIGERDE